MCRPLMAMASSNLDRAIPARVHTEATQWLMTLAALLLPLQLLMLPLRRLQYLPLHPMQHLLPFLLAARRQRLQVKQARRRSRKHQRQQHPARLASSLRSFKSKAPTARRT